MSVIGWFGARQPHSSCTDPQKKNPSQEYITRARLRERNGEEPPTPSLLPGVWVVGGKPCLENFAFGCTLTSTNFCSRVLLLEITWVRGITLLCDTILSTFVYIFIFLLSPWVTFLFPALKLHLSRGNNSRGGSLSPTVTLRDPLSFQ